MMTANVANSYHYLNNTQISSLLNHSSKSSLSSSSSSSSSLSLYVLRSFSTNQHHHDRNNNSTTMDVIINAVGEDRLGIVSDVSKIVIECGGNVSESVAGRLGSHFSLMMLVTIPKSSYDIIQQQIRHVPDLEGAVFDTKTSSSSATATSKKTPMIGYSGQFRLEGADHPGIVHQVTHALAKNSLNIDRLQTEQELAPYGGTVLFKMHGIVVATAPLAKHFDIQKIKHELNELGNSLNCDISLDDSIDEQYQGSFYAG
jgi:glycine cleavage system transcriptional repressor